MIVGADQIPGRDRLPGGCSFFPSEACDVKRLLHSCHDIRFVVGNIGSKRAVKLFAVDPEIAVGVSLDR